MKYGETLFDILYLLLAVIGGIVIARRARSRAEKLMGLAVLVLGLGDAFHLVPRMIRYFSSAELTAALGLGKLVTSVTMTGFYVCMYYIWLEVYGEAEDRRITAAVWALAVLRAALCLFPQNGWLENSSPLGWAVARNLPFIALGGVIVLLYYRRRGAVAPFRRIWLYVTLSFLFYIPVAVGAGAAPMLGMLMLPKTVCYILLIVIFLRWTLRNVPPAGTSHQNRG